MRALFPAPGVAEIPSPRRRGLRPRRREPAATRVLGGRHLRGAAAATVTSMPSTSPDDGVRDCRGWRRSINARFRRRWERRRVTAARATASRIFHSRADGPGHHRREARPDVLDDRAYRRCPAAPSCACGGPWPSDITRRDRARAAPSPSRCIATTTSRKSPILERFRWTCGADVPRGAPAERPRRGAGHEETATTSRRRATPRSDAKKPGGVAVAAQTPPGAGSCGSRRCRR